MVRTYRRRPNVYLVRLVLTACAGRHPRELRPARDPELAEDVGELVAHGELGEEQHRRDLTVRPALDHEPGDLALTRAQHLQRAGVELVPNVRPLVLQLADTI